MAHIKSRKHPVARRLNCSAAVAMAFMALPGAVFAQQAAGDSSGKTDTLPQITVQGATDSFKADTVSSPKFTQPLLDTTQTITVIKSELVKQQGGTTLTDALRNTPGVGTFSLGENGSTNNGDAVYLRGFDTSNSIFVDNVRDVGAISRDLFNIDQVEVTKGPAGADTGRSAPTGNINLVTKQANLKEAYSGSVGVGSGDYKRVTADLNKPLDIEGGAAVRVNLVKDDSGIAGRDEVNSNKTGVAAALAFGLKTDTRTYVDFLHMDQKNVPDGGVPTLGLPGNPLFPGSPKVDSSNYYGTTSDFDNVKADMFTVRVEHDFSANVKLQNTTRYGKTTEETLSTSFKVPVLGGGSIFFPAQTTATNLGRSSVAKDQENEIISNQTNITAKFDTGTIKHSLVAGFELTREEQKTFGIGGLGLLPAEDLYNPNPDLQRVGYAPFKNGTNTDGTTMTTSAYVFDTLELNRHWQINGGVRLDHYSTDFDGSTLGVSAPELSKSGNLWNWKAGILYKPTEDSSLYAAYATSQQPPGGSNFQLVASSTSLTSLANSTAFDPQKTKTAEIGGKWDVLDKQLSLTAALYRTVVMNEVQGDTINGFSQDGKKRVQGVEIGAVGNITQDWSISGGYTTMNTKVDGNSISADGSEVFSFTPKQAFTAWTTYVLPHGFTISGGARYIGKMNKPNDHAPTDVPQYIESYWVYDAAATYTINKHVNLQLNLYNLADKDYAASINKSGYRYTPGVERSARLTANITF